MCHALKVFLESNGKSAIQFARDISVTYATVSRYLSGTRIPEKEILHKIYVITQGSVTPNDFYDLPEIPATGCVPVAGIGERGQSPLRVRQIRDVNECGMQGMVGSEASPGSRPAGGNGSAMPSQPEMFASAHSFAEVRS